MDLFDYLEALDAPPLVAPMHFTQDVFPAAEFDRSIAAWWQQNGLGPGSHMWHTSDVDSQDAGSGHQATALRADLRCDDWRHRRCYDVGYYLMRVVCEPCRWASGIHTDQEGVVEWHDHAWPGWRDLSILDTPAAATSGERGALEKWHRKVEAAYPDDWGRPGAPIITRRSQWGTRHVPGRSPWGGFDLSHTALDEI